MSDYTPTLIGIETDAFTGLDPIPLSPAYDAIELAFICDWLRVTRPAALENVDVDVRETTGPGPDARVRLRDIENCYDSRELQLCNAVARLTLSTIQARLPQWACVTGDGAIVLGRTPEQRRNASIEPLPQLLFEINWADSGPGFSWPESYHVAPLPGLDVHVVTASQDSTDVHGVCDLALGAFATCAAPEDACRRIVTGWWRQSNADPELRWQALWRTGIVERDIAGQWADEVWGRRCEALDDTDPDDALEEERPLTHTR